MASARLARAAPKSWEEFLGAVAAYHRQQSDNCVQSPLEQLPVAQGRAQNAARFHSLLAACIASADKIERKSK